METIYIVPLSAREEAIKTAKEQTEIAYAHLIKGERDNALTAINRVSEALLDIEDAK